MDRIRHIQSHAGLRGVAAMLVISYHLQFGGTYHLSVEDVTPFLRRCYLFVDLFFVLSGFIISYINQADKYAFSSLKQYRLFIGRRLVRLYPLLFCTLVFMLTERVLHTLLLSSTGREVRIDWSGESLLILASQFLLLNAWDSRLSGWNVPTWSISAEMVAYLLFPIIVSFWIKRRSLTLFGLAALSAGFYGWLLATDRSLDIIGGLAPLRCLAGFSSGMMLYRARHRIARMPVTVLNGAQIGCVAGAVIVLATDLPDPSAVLFFGGLVVMTWTDRGVVAHLLGMRIPAYLGEISYSIYLTHVCLIEVLDVIWRGPAIERVVGADAARVAFITVCYGTVLLVSHVTFTRIEIPARRWLGNRLLGVRTGPIENSPAAP